MGRAEHSAGPSRCGGRSFLSPAALWPEGTFGISPSFLGLSQSSGQVTHVLLTRSRLCPGPKPGSSLHLHVLGTPPAFVLSQDQTLREELPQRVVRNIRSLERPQAVSRPATAPNPGPVPGGIRPLRPRSAPARGRIGVAPLSRHEAGEGWSPSTQRAPKAQDGVNSGTAVRDAPRGERPSDGVEPGHIYRPGSGRRVCMLLSFQRPSHLF